MLDKLKLFNKEKSDKSKSQISKRTSSSSGFSSARSERSDSSLSLNDGQTIGIQVVNKNSLTGVKKPIETTNSAKLQKTSSKLISSKSKDASQKNKTDKKDKSPARQIEIVDTKLLPPKSLQKIPSTKNDSKLKTCQLTKKSESKNSLIQPPKPIVQAVNTGIPKPMAAIKGTSKPPTEKLLRNDESQEFVKSDISLEKSHLSHGAGSSLNNHLLQNISMTESIHSNSTHSASTGLNSNSSESSVIYRPSSESGSDINHTKHIQQQHLPKNPIPNRKIDPMLQNDFINKFNTVPSKMMSTTTIYEEDSKQMTILPMRPLLRGYTSHVTLPTRGLRSGQHMVADYCEEIGQGYCSDGDALRKGPNRFGSSDIDNGYLSEGGISAKHYASILRGRPVLPTTIEERFVDIILNILSINHLNSTLLIYLFQVIYSNEA